MKNIKQSLINCPHCGKILSPELWEKQNSANDKIVKCTGCGGMKNWKNGIYHSPAGARQRYYCRDCGLRFSER